MLQINIINDTTGTIEVGNYRFDVLVNGKVIDSGIIINHQRNKGWRELLQILLDQNKKENNETLR